MEDEFEKMLAAYTDAESEVATLTSELSELKIRKDANEGNILCGIYDLKDIYKNDGHRMAKLNADLECDAQALKMAAQERDLKLRIANAKAKSTAMEYMMKYAIALAGK